MAALFRRREVWLPTLWGALLLLALAAALAIGFVFSLGPLLAPQAPAPGARTLVVEGWLDEPELRQAIATARSGRYERVLTTGGPIDPLEDAGGWKSYALRAAGLLRANGLAGMPVIAVPAPASAQDRSYLSAVMVREWVQQNDPALARLDLYSAGAHARRSRLVYRMALGDGVEVGVLAARPSHYDTQPWWASSSGAKTVVGELLGIASIHCCFWPGPPGSQEERRAVPADPK